MRRNAIFFSLAGLVLLVMPLSTNAGLVGYWSFDDDTASDSSSNGLDGTLNGGATFSSDVPAAIGSGRSLQLASGITPDGIGDYVDLGNPSILNFGTNDFTIAGWLKTDQSDRGSFFSNGGDNGGGIRYVLALGEGNDNKLTLTTDDNSTKRQAKGDTIINDGVWHHVAAVREGEETRVYVDGLVDGTIAVPAGYDLSGTSQLNAYIGVGRGQSGDSFLKQLGGLIDEVRVWDVAYHDDQIGRLAAGVPEPGSIVLALLGIFGAMASARRLRR